LFRNKIYNAIKFAQIKIIIFYNAKHRKLDLYDNIYIKIIKIKKIKYYLFARSSNLSTKKIESFKIIRKIKNLTYKLKLLSHIKIYNIIFVKYLEQINYNALQRNVLQLSLIKHKSKKLYIIKRVIRRKIKNNKSKYIVK